MPRKISTVERVVKARNRRQAKTGPEKELQKRHDADRKAKFDCLKKLKETGIWKSAPESLKQQLEDNALAQLWQERFNAKRSKECKALDQELNNFYNQKSPIEPIWEGDDEFSGSEVEVSGGEESEDSEEFEDKYVTA
ncbi:uncharacterized protein ATNIH1004_011838 [Aspergillus tanneri]|uniref:Uncharacterized protein n=1 Tax=Aspergillus tanneri TaxID=1220188 RepID=A0A5M9M3U7_9EURO|nr:uncharacterized protein ATNIH1004_011838 [Aspergillus tanneri]KAA8641702.1 hypothetical protein ATNIH1004_011838 [Aspergillus tanneri]